MQKTTIYILSFIFCILLISCSQQKSKLKKETETATTPEEANSFALCLLRNLPSLEDTDSMAAHNAANRLLTLSTGDSTAIHRADSILYLYLAEPNSPYRNEEAYIVCLESLLSLEYLPEGIRFRDADRLRRAKLNRRGSKANNFNYIDRYGHSNSLHNTKAEEILLIFYDPECTHCSEILDRVSSDEDINAEIGSGKLTVLAVYTEGNRTLWENTKQDMPDNWTVGYDMSNIVDNEIYDIPAMPTAYLLDSTHRVVVKDIAL